jgi:hypothetical protein
MHVHRTTFSRQAANLWKAKERLWQELVSGTPHDPTFALADSLPLPRRAPSPEPTAVGVLRERQPLAKTRSPQADLLRLQGAREGLLWPGVISRISVAPANAPELSVLPELTERTFGPIVGDRNYHSPKRRQELAGMGVELLAPYSSKKRDPHPKRSAFLSRLRYRIDTVFSQLTERYSVKKVWARDLWHLASRLLRKILSHTVAFLLNHQMDNPPLQLSKLLL